MLPAPVPADETQRLDALHKLKLLDTPSEERFDRITKTALRLLSVPIATLALVDAAREWRKSAQGLTDAEEARANSFSGHALLAQDLFVVPDAQRDPRFVDNPSVMFKPHIRFYAGLPVRGPEEKRVGVFCVMDYQPRELSPAAVQALRFLADWAERELNRSR